MFARTGRLLLRPRWQEDAASVLAAGVEAGITTLPQLLILERTAVIPRLVGGFNLIGEGCDVALNFWIVPIYRGCGFATEAGQAVVAMARDTLRIGRLVAYADSDNPAARRVLAKLGFGGDGANFVLEPQPVLLAA